jgi:hypothetical protein
MHAPKDSEEKSRDIDINSANCTFHNSMTLRSLIVFLFTTSIAFGQTSFRVSGNVTDSHTGEPLPYATVSVACGGRFPARTVQAFIHREGIA